MQITNMFEKTNVLKLLIPVIAGIMFMIVALLAITMSVLISALCVLISVSCFVVAYSFISKDIDITQFLQFRIHELKKNKTKQIYKLYFIDVLHGAVLKKQFKGYINAIKEEDIYYICDHKLHKWSGKYEPLKLIQTDTHINKTKNIITVYATSIHVLGTLESIAINPNMTVENITLHEVIAQHKAHAVNKDLDLKWQKKLIYMGVLTSHKNFMDLQKTSPSDINSEINKTEFPNT